MAFTLLLAPPACAGHYLVAYSANGPATISPDNYPPPAQAYFLSYTSTSSGYGIGVGTSGFPASASANSQITATFNWTQDSPTDTSSPPQEVIVTETSTATATAGAAPVSSSGSVDDGLGQGDPLTGPGASSSGSPTMYSYSQTSSGTRYSIHSGGSFTVTCTPTASANSGTAGQISVQCSAEVSVAYSATATALTIYRNGQPLTYVASNGVHNDHVLPGEVNSLSVSGIPAGQDVLYSWSVAGSIFSQWNVASAGNDSNGYPQYQSASIVAVGSTAAPTFSYCYSSATGAGDISCGLVINGQSVTVGGALDVTNPVVTTQQSSWGLYGDGDVRLLPVAPATPTLFGLLPLDETTNSNDGGIVFLTSVSIPTGWTPGGALNYAQLITPEVHFTDTSGNSWHVMRDGTQGEDTGYPNMGVSGTVGADFQAVDSPQVGLGSLVEFDVNQLEEFVTSLIFTPSGGQSVSLVSMTWDWMGDATLSVVTGWTISNSEKNKYSWATDTTQPTWTFAVHPGDVLSGF